MIFGWQGANAGRAKGNANGFSITARVTPGGVRVPDAGSTFPLLGLGLPSLATFRRKFSLNENRSYNPTPLKTRQIPGTPSNHRLQFEKRRQLFFAAQ
jgi:hypothetical protein